MASSDASSTHPRNSPLESTSTSHSDGQHYPVSDKRGISPSPHRAIYDDPRRTNYYTSTDTPPNWRGLTTAPVPRRPGLLRTQTDDGLSRSQASTPTPRGESRAQRADRAVRTNVLMEGAAGKRNWGVTTLPGSGRVTAMAQGPDGKYAIGGGQCEFAFMTLLLPWSKSLLICYVLTHSDLKILQIVTPTSGTNTPNVTLTTPTSAPLARGPGGATISEVANLWRGQWGVNKGVNDLDWGVGRESARLVTWILIVETDFGLSQSSPRKSLVLVPVATFSSLT